jgi:hypothetical protein
MLEGKIFMKDFQKDSYNKNVLMEKDDKNLLVTFKNTHSLENVVF